MNLGRALADAFEDCDITGPIVGCEADDTTITVWRLVQTSDGKSVAMFEDPETGEINDVCRVSETFYLGGR